MTNIQDFVNGIDEHVQLAARKFVSGRLPPKIADSEIVPIFRRMRSCIDPTNFPEVYVPRGVSIGEATDAQGFSSMQRQSPHFCWDLFVERTVLCWGYWNFNEFARERESLVALFENNDGGRDRRRDFRAFWKRLEADIKTHRKNTARLRAEDENDRVGCETDPSAPGVFIVNTNRIGFFVSEMDEIVKKHAEDERVFSRGLDVVSPAFVTQDDGGRRVEIIPMTANRACGMFSRLASFGRIGSQGELLPCDPPKTYGELWLDRDETPPFSPLYRVAYGPTFMPDRSFVTNPGYHERAGLYLLDTGTEWPMLPDEPTREDALAALKELDEAIYNSFPYCDPPGQAIGTSKSVALSALLTMVARPMLDIVPLHLVTAPQNRSGKSMVILAASVIGSGSDPSNAAQKRTREGAEEEGKTIKAFIRGGRSTISFDNITGRFMNDQLAAWLTQRRVDLRNFGTLDDERPLNTPLWAATGVNIAPAGDLVPRTVICTLDSGTRRATDRVQGRRENAEEWLHHNRPRLYMAAACIIRAWLLARQRGEVVQAGHIDSFGQWRDTVAGSLVWLGLPDPLGSISTGYEGDQRDEDYTMLFTAIRPLAGVAPFSASDLVRLVEESETFLRSSLPLAVAVNRSEERDEKISALGVVLRMQARERNIGDIDAGRLGSLLSGAEGHEAGGLQLRKVHPRSNRGWTYRLARPGDQEPLPMALPEAPTGSDSGSDDDFECSEPVFLAGEQEE